MDGTQFDTLVRRGAAGGGRRRLMRVFGAGLLGGFGNLAVEQPAPAASAGKGCREDCGPCGQCEPGKCKRKRGKKKCKPGVCVTRDNGAACGNSGTCQNGNCSQTPTCRAAGQACAKVGGCCSGFCIEATGVPLSGCGRGAAGARCYVDNDCESQDCRNFHCC